MYTNILMSTDGSDVANAGVKHGMDLAKSLNAKATVITVTEPLPIDFGSGHASGWVPSQEEFDRIYRTYFTSQDALPARTRMQAGRTPMDCGLEVEAIGYVP